MVINLIIVALCLGQTAAYYCFSQCSTSVNSSCSGPYTCASYSFPFTALNTLNAAYGSVDMATVATMTSTNNFKMSQTFTPFICSVAYTSPTLNVTYNYNILGKFVSTDYIYKRYTITQAHYQIMIKLSVIFIGVWSINDYLNLYTTDGTTTNNFPMRYTCTSSSVSYTQNLCSSNRNGNHVDCVLSFTNSFNHNSTYLLVNVTSLTSQKDSNNQFWSPLDLNIITVKCHSFCSACYSNLDTTCTACIAGKYLTGNTCGTTCASGYTFNNSNPLQGGFCVASCPQGYYLSTLTCVACSTGCLTCTSASNCLLTANSAEKYSLWMDKLALWIVIIAVGCLLIFGIIWKIFCQKKQILNQQQQRIISQVNDTRDEKLTTQQKPPENNEKNIHIEQIDFNDHIMVDTNPRKRKRQERDMNRSNININL